jgi:hypothetical protein
MEAEPVVVRRIYPANVTLSNGTTHRGVLAIITQHRVYVWAQLGGTVTNVLDEAYQPPGRPLPHVAQLKSAPLVLDLGGGPGPSLVEIRAAAGCGCGSLLTTFRPFAADVTGPTR